MSHENNEWMRVPVVPTPEMVAEGACAQSLPGPHYISPSAARACWKNMLAAAPQAPAHREPAGWPENWTRAEAEYVASCLESRQGDGMRVGSTDAGARFIRDVLSAQQAPAAAQDAETDGLVAGAWDAFNAQMDREDKRADRLRAAMDRFDETGPYPGMIAAFENQFGQTWTDPEWRQEASVWAAAWKSATAPAAAHSDNEAVDRFAAAMKAKLAAARAKGRGGWDDPAQCAVEHLSQLLRSHVEKGDPVDVANFSMMLHQRGAGITAPQAPAATLDKRDAEDELNCAEEVLDGYAAEFSDTLKQTDFECIGDYITAVVEAAKLYTAPQAAEQGEPITIASLARASGQKASAIFPSLARLSPSVTLNQPLDVALLGSALAHAAEPKRVTEADVNAAADRALDSCAGFDAWYGFRKGARWALALVGSGVEAG